MLFNRLLEAGWNGFIHFPKALGRKKERLEFKLVYYDVTIQHFSRYATETPHVTEQRREKKKQVILKVMLVSNVYRPIGGSYKSLKRK